VTANHGENVADLRPGIPVTRGPKRSLERAISGEISPSAAAGEPKPQASLPLYSQEIDLRSSLHDHVREI
jgi:hypothetical protein